MVDTDEAGSEGVDLVIECEELLDSSAPLRQGDVFEWLNDGADPWRRYAIIVTADCDIAHQKHGGLLACVPVLQYDYYLALFPLPNRLSTAQSKLLERATALIREYQAANRPDFPVALSDRAVAAWIEASLASEIIDELRIADGRRADQLRDVLSAIKQCWVAANSGEFEVQLDALAQAILVTQSETNFEKRREVLARELLDRLQRLPGDAIFLHALSPHDRGGYVAYLRSILNVEEGTIARRVPDLRDGSVQAKRISRLTSPYVFHLSQQLGQIFSAIGLPSPYEASRTAFIAECASRFGGVS